MTSHELARKLLAGEDIPVLINGYEGGFTTIKDVTCREMTQTQSKPDYIGEYDLTEEDPPYEPLSESFKAVILSRYTL